MPPLLCCASLLNEHLAHPVLHSWGVAHSQSFRMLLAGVVAGQPRCLGHSARGRLPAHARPGGPGAALPPAAAAGPVRLRLGGGGPAGGHRGAVQPAAEPGGGVGPGADG